MLAFTIIMVFLFLITVFVSEMAKSVYKNKEKLSEKEFSQQLGGVGCLMAIITVPYLVAYFIFLLKFLTIDPLYYPSVIILSLYILEILVAMLYVAIKKNKKPVTKSSPTTIAIRSVTGLFYMYALFVLIVGI